MCARGILVAIRNILQCILVYLIFRPRLYIITYIYFGVRKKCIGCVVELSNFNVINDLFKMLAVLKARPIVNSTGFLRSISTP